MQPARQQSDEPRAERSPRARMIAAIHIKFKQVRRDLRGCTEAEIREERLAFINQTLNLKRPVSSMRDLTDRRLGLVLDKLSQLLAQPPLPNSRAVTTPQTEGSGGAEIVHLASAEQVYVINKLLDFLGWGLEAREKFISQRFKSKTPNMLSQKQAQSLTMILLYIAAQRSVKDRTGVARVSRKMIQAEIPDLKTRLGIDRKPSPSSGDSSD